MEKLHIDPEWHRIQVFRYKVTLPSEETTTMPQISIRYGTSVLPMDNKHNVYLSHIFPFPINNWSLEVASGGIRDDETSLQTAKRKIRQELGLEAREWHSLGYANQLTSLIDHREDLFVAQDLSPIQAEHYATEPIELIKMPLEEAAMRVLANGMPNNPYGESKGINSLQQGSIRDAVSSLLILKAHALFNNPKLFEYLNSEQKPNPNLN